MKLRQKLRRAALIAAFVLLPITLYYFSPVLSLQGSASGIASGSLLVFAGLFVSSLFIGRAFCGWACPMGGLQELTFRLRGRPVARRRLRWIKYLIWAPWLLLVLFLAWKAGGWRRVEFTYMTWHGISVADLPGLITMIAVALVFFVPAAMLGRRASCHTLCWIAPFLIAGRTLRNLLSWPSLHLTARAEACRECGSCTRACPMSIEVQQNVRAARLETTDCILCGSCADACPNHVIRLEFSSRRGFALLPALLLFLLLPLAGARADSLFPLPAARLGGAGGPHFKLTWFAGEPGMLGGGPAWLIVDRSLYLGLSGSYLEGNTDEFMIGYLGPSAGWELFPDSWVGLWLGGTAALGGMREPSAGSSAVFVLEPEAVVQFALGPYCRLSVGGTYRWVVPFREVPGYGMRELSGPSILFRTAYGVFRPARAGPAGDDSAAAPAAAPPNPKVGILGCWSQKFSLVRGQLTRYDGGYTRLVFKDRWAVGAMGYRAPGGTKIGANDFQMMESGVWAEYFFDPSRRLHISIGALTGIALVGYTTPADELVGSPSFLISPEVLGYLNLSDFVRLSAGLAFRTAIPFQEVPGLTFWDYGGPTVSLNLVFGVF